MNGFIRFLILGAMIANLTSCMSRSSDDDLSLDIEDGTELAYEDGGEGEFSEDEFSDEPVVSADAGSTDEFSDEFGDDSASTDVASSDGEVNDFSDFSDDSGSDVASNEFDDSFSEPSGTPAAGFEEDSVDVAQGDVSVSDEFADFEDDSLSEEQVAVSEPAVDDFSSDSADVVAIEDTPEPELVIDEPEVDVAANSDFEDTAVDTQPVNSQSTNITDLNFQANQSGGTVVVTGDQPLAYKTRVNSDSNQFVVEVENTNLPNHLKRSLNTKDIQGSIGAVDAYQNPGSSVARFVVQMRPGSGTPVVQQEGNSLLIIANGAAVASSESSYDANDSSSEAYVSSADVVSQDGDMGSTDHILPSQNLQQFLSGNTKFYGKKISVETNNMDIRDALNLITEESGVNMIVSDEIKGSVNLKLRQVPWDQALVVLMRAKKLGYTRQGNVLRIAPIAELKGEEEDATKLAMINKVLEPTVVRMFPVSYAKVDDLEKKIKEFMGERGKVVGDPRTNSIVVTDIEENVERVAKLISSLDTQPPQVSIEGKIVEATESFTRNIGVAWSLGGSQIKLGTSARGPVNMMPTMHVNSSAGLTPGNMFMNLNVGTLDVFGTLNATLNLNEQTDQVKVISAPRITTLSNEPAGITQVTEVPVKSVTQNGTATVTTYTFKPLTLKLDVTPQVTADGSVIMKVLVNRQFQGADISADGSGQFSVNSREANTRVLVKNGQTAVIGGIYQSDATNAENGVPWFKDIPLLKYFFSTTNTRKDKSELMIFLTPRIQGEVFGRSGNSTL